MGNQWTHNACMNTTPPPEGPFLMYRRCLRSGRKIRELPSTTHMLLLLLLEVSTRPTPNDLTGGALRPQVQSNDTLGDHHQYSQRVLSTIDRSVISRATTTTWDSDFTGTCE